MKNCNKCEHNCVCNLIEKGMMCDEKLTHQKRDCPYEPTMIRCRECEYSEYAIYRGNTYLWCTELDSGNTFVVDENDFCSFGKRKEEEK